MKALHLTGHTLPIRDSLAVLRDDRTGHYQILDCHDWTVPFDMRSFLRDLRCRRILKCQFRAEHMRGFRAGIVRPWTYFDVKWPNEEARLTGLRTTPRTREPLHFRGQLWDERKPVVELLRRSGTLNPDGTKLPYEAHLEEMAEHKLILSLPGFAEFCHRDVEAFGAGLCVLRPELRNRFHDPLQPDVHYLSVSTVPGKDRPSTVAERIERRYREVIGDSDLLARVARNGAEWYDRNVRPPASMELTARLLGLLD